MAASLFSQPPIAYFQPLQSPPNACTPSFISCETPDCSAFGEASYTEFETISSKVCGWAGELGKDHDLRQSADPCTWLFSEQAAPFPVGAELPSSALIPAAQRQPRVDFISSAAAMKNIFRAACDQESDVGVMVHRLGDWLVIDDGTEISEFLVGSQSWQGASSGFVKGAPGLSRNSKGTPAATAVPSLAAERLAEQRHCGAAKRAELAKVCATEAQQRLEKAWSMLRQAEAEAKTAQDMLHEALADVGQAREELDRIRRQRSTVQESPSKGAATVNLKEWEIDPKLPSLDIDVEAPEELQLYQNFLGHSILRALNDDPSTSSSPLEAASTGSHNGSSSSREILAFDGPSAFRQVGVWKIADDASIVIGSQMLCLGNAEHPKLTLYLHHHTVLSDMQLLEHCIECLIAGVPEFAVCFHRDGAVQSYSLYKLSELWTFLEERLAIGRKLWMTLEALRWIRHQCSSEGCTYWLAKAKSEPTLKLFKLTGTSTLGTQKKPKRELQTFDVFQNLPKELVLKNTFLHVAQEAEVFEAEFRSRAQSCPARIYGNVPFDDDCSSDEPPSPSRSTSEATLLHSKPLGPLRGRVSALFFRRAISSPPSANASRFFQRALDLEAQCGSDSEEDQDEIDSKSEVLESERMLMQSCCHLGLALCDLSSSPSALDSGEGSMEALLIALRSDAPIHRTAKNVGGKYRVEPLSCMRRHLPLLGICIPPWPSCLQGSGKPLYETDSPCSITALHRVADALSLLTAASLCNRPFASCCGSSLSPCNRKGIEAIAFPLVVLVLLDIASELSRYTVQDRESEGGTRVEFTAISLAWQLLLLARQFAALDSVQQRPKVQPFFSRIPSSHELFVRVEHLCGGLLMMSASQCSRRSEANDAASLELEPWFVEVRRHVSKLHDFLRLDQGRVDVAMTTFSDQLSCSETVLDVAVGECPNKAISDMPFPAQQDRYLHAAWYYERSIRLLPKTMHRGAALNQLMLVLSTALLELAAHEAKFMDVESCDNPTAFVESLQHAMEVERHLNRAEGLADAAGHGAMAALIQASRGHLRGCAADMLVRLTLSCGADFWETSLYASGIDTVRALFCLDSDDDDDDNDEDDDEQCKPEEDASTVGQSVGRLGDIAMEWVLSSQQSVDNVIYSEAATVLCIMSSGVLQAGAMRLWALPPPRLPEAECRRTVSTLVTQSLHVLPQSRHSDKVFCRPLREAHLYAHAHMLQAEIVLESRCAASGAEKQQRHQRVTWNIERARLALHSTTTLGVAACVLLLRLHLIHARLLLQNTNAPKRQVEQAVEELVSACRVCLSTSSCNDEATAILATRDECWRLLLQQLQSVLRGLCMQKQEKSSDEAPSVAWKEFYRAILQLDHIDIAKVPALYDSFKR